MDTQDQTAAPILEHGGYYSVCGKCPECDARIALRFQIGLAKPRKHTIPREVIEKIVPLLGTMSDSALARKFGVSSSFVGRERMGRNIARFQTPSTLIAAIDELLPTMKNKDIAHQLGTFPSIVAARRLKTKIKTLPGVTLICSKRERVLELHEKGLSMTEIGRVMRLTRQRIEQIIKEL